MPLHNVSDWIGAACCLGFPAWVMLAFLLLRHWVKRPADEPQAHGFPVGPKEEGKSKTPSE